MNTPNSTSSTTHLQNDPEALDRWNDYLYSQEREERERYCEMIEKYLIPICIGLIFATFFSFAILVGVLYAIAYVIYLLFKLSPWIAVVTIGAIALLLWFLKREGDKLFLHH
ncbi:MAG: hypothetical protein ABI430_02415 [Candidatus Taylorbacteria bacterium]